MVSKGSAVRICLRAPLKKIAKSPCINDIGRFLFRAFPQDNQAPFSWVSTGSARGCSCGPVLSCGHSLVRAAHDQLLTSPKPQAFKKNWNRIANNFDHLYTTPDSIKQLRQTTAQLAIRGKLKSAYNSGESSNSWLNLRALGQFGEDRHYPV